MSKEKTATEWLFQKIWDTPKDKFIWHALLKQAKEMEKQQIIDAFEKGGLDGWNLTSAEYYYNDTYNTNHE
jgi:hypothetical protein